MKKLLGICVSALSILLMGCSPSVETETDPAVLSEMMLEAQKRCSRNEGQAYCIDVKQIQHCLEGVKEFCPLK